MIRIHKQVSIFLIVLLLFSFVGCTQFSDNDSKLQNNSQEDIGSIEVSVVDQAGRNVVLEKPAETIVSSYYITTYATIALDITDKLIGIEKKAESRHIYALAAEELLEVTQVGSLKDFNIEAVAELNPDLVLMPIRLLDQANTLTDLGINTLVVDPETQEGLNLMIKNISILTDSEARAQKLFNAQDTIYQSIEELINGKVFPNIYMGSNSDLLESATSKMYQNFLINSAGGTNVFSDLTDTYWTPISYETLLERNPDYIIIPTAANYTVEDILTDKQLKDINAIKNLNVYQMPTEYEELDSPVPSGVLGVYWLAVTLHGDDEDLVEFEETFNNFYKEFYGFETAGS